jgi:hypothetical protein
MQTNLFKQNFSNIFPSSKFSTNQLNSLSTTTKPFKKTKYKPQNEMSTSTSTILIINPQKKQKNSNDKFILTSNSNFIRHTEILDTQNNSKDDLSNLINIHNHNNNLNHTQTNSQSFLMNHKVFFSHFKNYEEAKFSSKSYGSIISYGVNTNKGQVRNYNEDRVSIILNVLKPVSRKNEDWPKVSFFGIFDGHGGTKCPDFLKENLHHYV